MSKLSSRKGIFFLCVFCGATAIALPAQTFTTLVSFDGTDGTTDGTGPSLVQGFDGSFYQTTFSGGTINSNCASLIDGCGTFFKVTPAGRLTTLYKFCSTTSCTDGSGPGAVVQATDRSFYGTTAFGGANSNSICDFDGLMGCGTVFKITPAGRLTTLYSFCSKTNCTDGYEPSLSVIQGTDGNFYGTTSSGGANSNSICESNGTGCGTVFKITPAGGLTTLYNFCSKTDCADGYSPAALIQGADGNLYGTTFNGGANCQTQCVGGTIFKITSTGKLITLYSFCSKPDCTDGYEPSLSVQGTAGNFYGTTIGGGADCQPNYAPCGTFFKITPTGRLTTLYNFCTKSNCPDGRVPWVVQDSDGNFYGATFGGGSNTSCSQRGCGTAFKIAPTDRLTTLYNFCSKPDCTDGSGPGALVQGTDGGFYGTTDGGGTKGWGTVFRLSVGLPPFVKFLLPSGNVGAVVYILGTNLKSASKVSFNGTAAKFTVVSATEITASVPDGATSGSVTVATSGSTLKSNQVFRVTPQITSFSPTNGPVETEVTINGESFTGATSVAFGGVNATNFKVDSYTQITATVPGGSKTGKITVTTPGGTATSAGSFTVP
jgi:uncharacterized repeat protein (TIGR03803 family)